MISTLQGLGIHVINAGLSTTPTVEMLVPRYQAQGGIILTASHNPKQWNALKLLNDKGEFVSGSDGAEILELAEGGRLVMPRLMTWVYLLRILTECNGISTKFLPYHQLMQH